MADDPTIIQKKDKVFEKTGPGNNACLVIIHGSQLGKKYNLDALEMCIGRGENVEVRVNEENVSRKHARIINKGDKVIIEDLDSTNGTYINTKKTKTTILKDGDLILIGNTILKFISQDNIENAYHEVIYRLATLDGLTQVYNKKFFMECLFNEFSRSKRYRRDLSLVLFDLDHFKLVNDIHGHPAGDYILKRLSSLVTRNLRKEDIIGRYGGEEFGIILPETNEEKAGQIAEKLRKLVEGIDFNYNDKDIPVTISMGVTSLTPSLTKFKNYNDMIEDSDKALYEAKKRGRNRVVLSKEMN
ncbi:MAG: diguanylate cyclase [Pseudomonadota bacterium]